MITWRSQLLNRWSFLALVVGVLAGYSFTGSSDQAQAEPLPFAVGETVTLSFGKDATPPSVGTYVECTVAEIRGVFVRCGRRSRIGESIDRSERWFTMKYVVLVTKRDD